MKCSCHLILSILTAAMLAICHLPAWAGHTIVDGQLADSHIYPGTVHDYKIYVPDGYDGHSPASLYVGLDGILCRAPQVMDSLMATGDMPVTIGVFLQPGLIKDAAGNVLRYNRSNEFDATDHTFAAFLEQELLPRIEATVLPDGRRIMLSHNGSDHMIFGLSSGGIAAFVAAWHRPDLFGRVFTGVGTFVAMRGGNDLQALVRKSEPKPLKIFVQDGTQDAWNPLFGHWYEGNQLMASALKFAGYDVDCDWSDTGHNVRRATEIFPQVMKWLWQGWPASIHPRHTGNDLLASLLVDNAQWHETQHPTVTPQPVGAVYPDSSLMVMPQAGSNYLLQYVLIEGRPQHGQRFYWLHTYDNSQLLVGPMAFDGNGNLWVVTNAGIQICDQNGRVRGIVALPPHCPAATIIAITIDNGLVTLHTDTSSHSRHLNVTPATSGTRPPSQGQG